MTFGKVMGGGSPQPPSVAARTSWSTWLPRGPSTRPALAVATAAGLAQLRLLDDAAYDKVDAVLRAAPRAGHGGAEQGGRGAPAAERLQHVLGLLHRA